MSVRHWFTWAALLGGFFTTSPASAYVRSLTGGGTPVVWKNPCINMVVHTANAPAPLTAEMVLKMTSAAGAAWGKPGFTCTPLQITTTATDEVDAPAKNDGVNRVMFRRDKWCRVPAKPDGSCYDKGILAITTVTARADGTIIDADIEINAVDFQWTDLTVKGNAGQDLQTVLTHEFGHLIGLDHNCSGGTKVYDHTGKEMPTCAASTTVTRAAVMYPAPVTVQPIRRTMSTDEALAICQVYPNKSGVNACVNEAKPDAGGGARDAADGGVNAGGEPPAQGCSMATARASEGMGAVQLALAAALAWLTARRRKPRR